MAAPAHLNAITSSAAAFAPSRCLSGNVTSRSAAGVGVGGLVPRTDIKRLQQPQRSVQRRRNCKGPCALFDRGSGTGDDGEKKDDKKKFITRDQEPEQYWQTADEREGKNPFFTPLPYIVILSVLSPFIILAVAFANNWIKIPIR